MISVFTMGKGKKKKGRRRSSLFWEEKEMGAKERGVNNPRPDQRGGKEGGGAQCSNLYLGRGKEKTIGGGGKKKGNLLLSPQGEKRKKKTFLSPKEGKEKKKGLEEEGGMNVLIRQKGKFEETDKTMWRPIEGKKKGIFC